MFKFVWLSCVCLCLDGSAYIRVIRGSGVHGDIYGTAARRLLVRQPGPTKGMCTEQTALDDQGPEEQASSFASPCTLLRCGSALIDRQGVGGRVESI